MSRKTNAWFVGLLSLSGAQLGSPTISSAQTSFETLRGGFSPDPFTARVNSGGFLNADELEHLPAGCVGFIGAQPTFVLNYADAAEFLRFYVEAEGDTTLVIEGDDGRFICDDNSGGRQNPMVSLRRPLSGRYNVWVGSYNVGEQVRGTLSITELEGNRPYASQGSHASVSQLQTGGERANFGTGNLRGGFMPDPTTISVTSGGSIDANAARGLPLGCHGFVTARPDYILNYNDAANFLRFYVEGRGDTTLIINDGEGNWHCDDDGGGNQNPMIDLRRPPSGHYDIWIGSYRSGEQIRGTLSITELETQRPNGNTQNNQDGSNGSVSELQIGGDRANFGTGNLRGGFAPDPENIRVSSGGSVSVREVRGLPSDCRGYATRQPDYILNYRDAADFLRFYVEGRGDTTLIINDGAGNWHCDDDGGGNQNPMIDLRRPPSGHYDIWVGSYSSSDQIEGTLSITELEDHRPGRGHRRDDRRGRNRRR